MNANQRLLRAIRGYLPKLPKVSPRSNQSSSLYIGLGASALSILVVSMLFFGPWPLVGTPRPKPPPPSLQLRDVNVVTAEPSGVGMLRVWAYNGSGIECIWSVESVHSSAAIGDIDGDGKREILCTTWRTVHGKGYSGTAYEIFITIYKDGLPYSAANVTDAVLEPDTWWMNDAVIANVDADPEVEVVMVTESWLAIYEYDSAKGLHLGRTLDFRSYGATYVRSLSIGDVDESIPGDEIAVAVSSTGGSASVYIFSGADNSIRPLAQTSMEAFPCYDCLRIGDIDGDGDLEICSTGSLRVSDTLYLSRLFIWTYKREGIITSLVLENLLQLGQDTTPSYDNIDIGELDDSNQGEEIAIAIRDQTYSLVVYQYDGDGLDELWRADSVYCHPIIGDADMDQHNEIIAMVHSSQETKKGEALCLAIFDRTETGEWTHFDSELGEYGYHDAAVG